MIDERVAARHADGTEENSANRSLDGSLFTIAYRKQKRLSGICPMPAAQSEDSLSDAAREGNCVRLETCRPYYLPMALALDGRISETGAIATRRRQRMSAGDSERAPSRLNGSSKRSEQSLWRNRSASAALNQRPLPPARPARTVEAPPAPPRRGRRRTAPRRNHHPVAARVARRPPRAHRA